MFIFTLPSCSDYCVFTLPRCKQPSLMVGHEMLSSLACNRTDDKKRDFWWAIC